MANNDTISKTFTVSILLCLLCSVLVSGAAVYLKPIQKANKEQDMKKNILAAAGLLEPGKEVDDLFKQVKPVVVNLEDGTIIKDIDANTFDQYSAVKNPEMVYNIPKASDIARIKVRAKYAKVYLVMDSGELSQVILPVHGKALWSTMYGFMALEKDTTTVKGFAFYAHGETPGLGGEVDNPNWKALWPGKKIFHEDWTPAISIIKGAVDKSNKDAVYQVDGLSGSTLTSRGVHNLLRYWIGENGFAKFLANLRDGGILL